MRHFAAERLAMLGGMLCRWAYALDRFVFYDDCDDKSRVVSCERTEEQ